MQVPFRFYRGELNGFYLLNLLTSRNAAVSAIVDELIYQSNMTWKLEEEIVGSEIAIRDSDLVGIAKFAGVLKSYQMQQSQVGSIMFTGSTVVNGVQRSERGLFNMAREKFEYVRTAQDDYPTDISTDASSAKRATLVPSGLAPVGYVAYGTDLYREDGTVIAENILASPPVDGTPYTAYYGPNYLVFEETFNLETEMDTSVFKKFFECIMRLRYGGVSIKELMYLTNTLTEGYVYDIEIVPTAYYYTVYYSVNNDLDIENRLGKLSAWEIVVGERFKNFVLVKRTE